MDRPADYFNSMQYIKYQLEELESLVRWYAETVGLLRDEIKRQDQEIENLKKQLESDGK